MSYPNNNFAGTNFGYHLGNEGYSDFGAPYYTPLDSDPPVADPSRSHDWYSHPSLGGYAGQFGYQQSTILDVSGHQFVDPYALHTEPAYGGFNTDGNVNGRVTYEQARNIPGLSAGGLAAAPRNSFMPPTPYPLTTSSGPRIPPPNTLWPDNYGPSTTPYAAGTLQHGGYEQPPAGPSSASHWPNPYTTSSVDEGKARATELPSFHPAVTGNDTRWYQQPHTTGNHGGSLPQTVLGVPQNIVSPNPIAHSSGPQRSVKSTKGKGRATSTDRDEGEHTDPLSVTIDSSWEQTKDRFVYALLEEYFFRPSGWPINPEMAFANINQHIKEDLLRSPNAAKAVRDSDGKHASRVYEQYVTHILRGLRGGEVQSEKSLFAEVLEELSNELAPVNTRRVPRGKHSKKKDSSEEDEPDEPEDSDEPEELDAKARHRKAERGRRTIIRGLLHEISAFFLVTGGKKVSGGDVILFVIIYLRIGGLAFPGLIQPRFPGDRQQP